MTDMSALFRKLDTMGQADIPGPVCFLMDEDLAVEVDEALKRLMAENAQLREVVGALLSRVRELEGALDPFTGETEDIGECHCDRARKLLEGDYRQVVVHQAAVLLKEGE